MAPAKETEGGALPFADVRKGIERIVRATFPQAKAGRSFGVDGWTIPRPSRAPRFEREGTMPSDRIMLGLAERKAGPTLYVWYPAPGAGLGARRKELEAAGFKVMVGCLVFAKKRPYPFDAVEALLRAIAAKDAAYA